jgi:hypothetical protein
MSNPVTLKTRVKHKHDIPANWEKAVNFIPLAGEIIIYDDHYFDENGDKVIVADAVRFKVGDGVIQEDNTVVGTKLNDLPFSLDTTAFVAQQDPIIGDYTIYGKRKIASADEEYPQFEDGSETVFRGSYYPNSREDFDKGDRRVVMYGKKGTFSVDMAEDRGEPPEDKHVVNRKFLADKCVPKIDYSGTLANQEYQLYATQPGSFIRTLDVHKGDLPNTIMMRDSSGTGSVNTPSGWLKESTHLYSQKIVNVNMLTDYTREYSVPKLNYSGFLEGQEYQLYAIHSENSNTSLNVHKGAAPHTVMMRDSMGTGSIQTPANWMDNLSTNAQKMVNVNMLVDYIESKFSYATEDDIKDLWSGEARK